MTQREAVENDRPRFLHLVEQISIMTEATVRVQSLLRPMTDGSSISILQLEEDALRLARQCHLRVEP